MPLPPCRPLALVALAAVAGGGPSAQPATTGPDPYGALVETNRAQLVALAEGELLPPGQTRAIARALRQSAADAGRPGAERSDDYLDLEADLVARVGPVASNLHLGRSRNDLGATTTRMALRAHVLDLLDGVGAARTALHGLAAGHTGTVMPGYTHAVQAQPTTLAHVLLALDASLGRDQDRLREVYARLNRSPLGAGAFTTSGFALDRTRLAELLGFDGLVENSYDAVMVATADSKVELAAALGVSAINVGRFAQSLAFQYADPAPGLYLSDDATGRSSVMPQKRNPRAVEQLRVSASAVVGAMHTSTLYAHNTPLYEVRDVRAPHAELLEGAVAEAASMYARLAEVVGGLVVRPDVLRAQVDADYSTMTELADALLREAGVPFRTGYAVASALTTYGRAEGRRPPDLTHAEVDAVYREVAGDALPLTAAQLSDVFDPAAVVRQRAGTGGPQPAETRRMLAAQRDATAEAAAWVAAERARLAVVSADLRARFDALAND